MNVVELQHRLAVVNDELSTCKAELSKLRVDHNAASASLVEHGSKLESLRSENTLLKRQLQLMHEGVGTVESTFEGVSTLRDRAEAKARHAVSQLAAQRLESSTLLEVQQRVCFSG